MHDQALSSRSAVRHSSALWLPAILWVVTYAIALLVLTKLDVSRVTGAIVAVLPVIPFSLFLHQFIQHLRTADELERRVQLEALAIAFPVTLVGLMLLGLLQLAIPLSAADWSYRHVWHFLPMLYFGSVAVTWRRYR